MNFSGRFLMRVSFYCRTKVSLYTDFGRNERVGILAGIFITSFIFRSAYLCFILEQTKHQIRNKTVP